MRVIVSASDNVIKLLGKAKTAKKYRLMTYVISQEVEEGVLIFHTLTREMLLLTKEEYAHVFDLSELYEKWFIVPDETDDMKITDQIRFILKAVQKKKEHITGYTVFTTTDCNARCFYCFEKDAKHYSMSEETAKKTVDFIVEHCKGNKVKIKWFGGEPLYNTKAIDTIVNGIKEKNIEFSSSMISNGYLLDKDTVKKAKELWNLKHVQITLDGTKNNYNKTKNYIYSDDSNPFETVLNNIGQCIENDIYVNIRLNVSATNANDLKKLVSLLHEKFGKNSYLCVYPAVLYQINTKDDDVRKQTHEKKHELEALIGKYGFNRKDYISGKLALNCCMADNDGSVTILPDGKIGACEHYLDSGFIGDIWSNEIDEKAREAYKKCYPVLEECASCYRYPICIRLKCCEAAKNCPKHLNKDSLTEIKESMKNTFYRKKEKEDEIDDMSC